MDSERSVVRNTIMTTTIPGKLIAVVTVVLWVVKGFLCLVRCAMAYFQRELHLFSELHKQNSASMWDDKGLFVAFMKGEDVHGRREMPNNLRLETEKKTEARVKNGNGMVLATKSPMRKELFITNLFLRSRRPSTHFRFSLGLRSGISARSLHSNSCDNKTADCTFVNPSKSGTYNPLTNSNRICAEAKQLHTQNRTDKRKDRCEIATAPPLCLHQGISMGTALNRHENMSFTCFHETILAQNNLGNKAVTCHEIEQSSLGPNKMKRRGRDMSHVHFIQLNEENKASLKVERSSFPGDKREKTNYITSDYCTNQVDIHVRNNEITSRNRRASPGVSKRKKRGTMVNTDCPPNQTESLEQCAKKTRKDPISVQCRHKMPMSSIVRKIIKDKTWQKMRAKVRQRKVKELVSRTDVPFEGQQPHLKISRDSVIAKAIQSGELSNANQPLQAMDQEPAAAQSVLGELVAAKTPLPATRFTLDYLQSQWTHIKRKRLPHTQFQS